MSVTRFPNGITTAKKTDFFGDFILPDPTTAHVYFEDFDYYNATDWTVTENGVATQVLTDADGGRLLISNDASNLSDSLSQKVGNSLTFELDKKLWFDCNFQISDAPNITCIVGLLETTTTPFTLDNAVHFQHSGGTNIQFHVEKTGIASITSAIGTIASAVDIRLSFYYPGKGAVMVFINGESVISVGEATIPFGAVLTPSYYVQNGEAASKTMSLDYLFAAKER